MDKFDEMAAVAGKAGGLEEKQWPGLAIIFRSLSRDTIEECAAHIEDMAAKYAKVLDSIPDGNNLEPVPQTEFLRSLHRIAATIRKLKVAA